MANTFYPKGKEAFATGGINWTSDAIKVVAVDLADYTYSATHQFLSDIPSVGRVATSGNLANKTATNGVLDADDITFTSVTGDQFEAVVIYKDTGTATTSNLIVFIDTATGLPFTPNSGNANVTWDNGANKIAAL